MKVGPAEGTPPVARWKLPDPVQKRVTSATKKKEDLVELAETISVRIESAIDPSVLTRLEGDALLKGTHNFMARTDKIAKNLRTVLEDLDQFRVFDP